MNLIVLFSLVVLLITSPINKPNIVAQTHLFGTISCTVPLLIMFWNIIIQMFNKVFQTTVHVVTDIFSSARPSKLQFLATVWSCRCRFMQSRMSTSPDEWPTMKLAFREAEFSLFILVSAILHYVLRLCIEHCRKESRNTDLVDVDVDV